MAEWLKILFSLGKFSSVSHWIWVTALPRTRWDVLDADPSLDGTTRNACPPGHA
jgi:hypothetical protein